MNIHDTYCQRVLDGDTSVTAEDLSRSFFEAKLDELNKERLANLRDAELAVVNSADNLMAEFFADFLREHADELHLRRDTEFYVKGDVVPKDQPAIVVSPLAPTEHTGAGTASGKVRLDFLNGAGIGDLAALRELLGRTATYGGNLSSVEYGNYPFVQYKLKNVVLPRPVIAGGSAAGIAAEFARLAGLLNQYGSYTDNVSLETDSGATSYERIDESTVKVTGWISVIPNEAYIGYTFNELKDRLKSVIDSRKGFAIGLGFIAECQMISAKPMPGGKGAHITFEAIAGSTALA